MWGASQSPKAEWNRLLQFCLAITVKPDCSFGLPSAFTDPSVFSLIRDYSIAFWKNLARGALHLKRLRLKFFSANFRYLSWTNSTDLPNDTRLVMIAQIEVPAIRSKQSIFSWHTKLIILSFFFEKAMSYLLIPWEQSLTLCKHGTIWILRKTWLRYRFS